MTSECDHANFRPIVPFSAQNLPTRGKRCKVYVIGLCLGVPSSRYRRSKVYHTFIQTLLHETDVWIGTACQTRRETCERRFKWVSPALELQSKSASVSSSSPTASRVGVIATPRWECSQQYRRSHAELFRTFISPIITRLGRVKDLRARMTSFEMRSLSRTPSSRRWPRHS